MLQNSLSKRTLIGVGIAILLIVLALVVAYQQLVSPRADVIPLSNVAVASYCSEGESTDLCNPATNKFSRSASSNQALTNITTSSGTTPLPTATATTVPAAGAPVIVTSSVTPSTTNAVFNWTTAATAEGYVRYNTAPNMANGGISSRSPAGTIHKITATPLLANTTYYYEIIAEYQGKVTKKTGSFNTLASGSSTPTPAPTTTATSTPVPGGTATPSSTGAPSITSSSVTPATTSSLVTWTTGSQAEGYVRYGLSPSSLGNRSSQSPVGTSHNVTIGGLTSNTTYYYEIVAEYQSKVTRKTGSFVTK